MGGVDAVKPRRKALTEIGIRRVKCDRCGGRPGFSHWQVCADGRAFRVLCKDCDIGLNRLVLAWIGDPGIEAKMAGYESKERAPLP